MIGWRMSFAIGIAAATAVAPVQGHTQVVQLADRSPAFFMATGRGGDRIDARNAAVFQQRISLALHEAPIADALQAIAAQASLTFTYRKDALPSIPRVSLEAKEITVAAALTVALLDAGVDVELVDNDVLRLVPRPISMPMPVRRARQGGGTIVGQVVDAVTRGLLDQVAVRVEGPGLGAVTASDGRYAVRNVPAGTYRVTARRVGYTPLTKTVTVVIDSAATVDFALAGTPTKLNEVVTTAVGDQRRYEVGNVISTINADSIAPTAPITSLTDLISARAPGVEVLETSGLTGSGEAIRIRGQSSLVLQSDPIIVVDGVRQDNTPGGIAGLHIGFGSPVTPSPSRLNDIDFGDIQSIDVLKGPSASTEYGTDAANGVIVITTKHGVGGRPQWAMSAERAASEIPVRFPDLYYSWGHTTDANHTPVRCPLVPNTLFGSVYGSAVGTCAVDSITTWDPLNHSQYSIFGAGNRQKYTLSLSGGSELIRYYVAGALSNETGILQLPSVFAAQAESLGVPNSIDTPNHEDQRSLRTNTSVQLGSVADLSVTGAYLSTYQKTVNAQQLYLGVAYFTPLPDAKDGYGYGSNRYFGPIYQLSHPTTQNVERLTGGITGNWRPLSWLASHGTIGIDHGSARNTAALLPQAQALFRFVAPQLAIENAGTDIYTVDLRASATVSPVRIVRSVTSAGLQLADTRLQGTTVNAIGLSATNFTLNGAVSPAVTQIGNRQATLGGYGEEQIGIVDRLFVTGAVRVDAASGFGSRYSTAAYPKASISWLALDKEPATVRLRAAFGESGVQPPNGAALQLFAPTRVGLNGVDTGGVSIANVQNQRLQPERSVEYEGGLDVGLWHNRVSAELTAYSKTTRDALVTIGTGWEAGGLPYEENIGKLRNSGLETAITAAILQARSLVWDLTLNASVNRNRLLELGPGLPLQQIGSVGAIFRFVPGRPIYGYWAPKVQYADNNHDGVIEPNEVNIPDSLQYVGSSLPTREASIATRVTLLHSALSLNALLDYRGGFRLINSMAITYAAYQHSDRASNYRASPLWEQARDVAAEAILASGFNGYASPASAYEDATFFRLREVGVTYSMPHILPRTLRVRSLSVTGAVRNLALWTGYTGVDPEVTNSEGTNAQLSPTSNTYGVNNDIRVDLGGVPLLRYWTLRVNLGL